MNAHYAGGVNNDLNSNITMYLAQVYDRFFLRSGKFTPHICESCGPPTNGRTKRLLRGKV